MANIRDLNHPDDPQFMRRQPPPAQHAGVPPEYAPKRPPLREDPTTVGSQIAALVKEVRDLRTKSDNDDKMIALLEQQRADTRRELEGLRRKQAIETENLRVNYEDQISALIGTRDVALQRAQAVSDVLQDAARHIMEGLRRMKGEETPPPPEQEADGERPPWHNALHENADT